VLLFSSISSNIGTIAGGDKLGIGVSEFVVGSKVLIDEIAAM
jgi:hypothetical protein